MKFGVADFGMNVWYGGLHDIEQRLLDLKEIGYDGTERLEADGAADAMYKACIYKKFGMDFSTCRVPTAQDSIQFTAAFGKKYVWVNAGDSSRNVDFDVYCRRVNAQIKACKPWGITVGIHNHLWQRVENQQELEDFLAACPEAGLVLDTGHLGAAGGDPVEIVKKYHKRICVMHLKDVFIKNPDADITDWEERGYFCELGAGNSGPDNSAVIKALVDVGYDGWIHIEHDSHFRDPLVDLKTSYDFLIDNGISNK